MIQKSSCILRDSAAGVLKIIIAMGLLYRAGRRLLIARSLLVSQATQKILIRCSGALLNFLCKDCSYFSSLAHPLEGFLWEMCFFVVIQTYFFHFRWKFKRLKWDLFLTFNTISGMYTGHKHASWKTVVSQSTWKDFNPVGFNECKSCGWVHINNKIQYCACVWGLFE